MPTASRRPNRLREILSPAAFARARPPLEAIETITAQTIGVRRNGLHRHGGMEPAG
jgi:hypothetical protein